MVIRLCLSKLLAGEFHHPSEQLRVAGRDDTHGLCPAGAGGFQVEAEAAQLSHIWEDGKLIAAGVYADPIAQGFGNLGVDGELLLKALFVADVVDSLLEFAAETGSHASDFYAPLLQFSGRKIVRGRSGLRLGLIN